MSDADKLTPEEMSLVRDVARRLRVTKVTATKAVKSKAGDSYVGFTACWSSVQDDGARDLADDQGSGSGMTLREAKVASLLLGMEADIAAYQNARSGGTISNEAAVDAIRTCKHNYMHQLALLVRKSKKEE